MKSKVNKKISNESLREDILRSMIGSFKIEGINIPVEFAVATLKKVEINLEKQK